MIVFKENKFADGSGCSVRQPVASKFSPDSRGMGAGRNTGKECGANLPEAGRTHLASDLERIFASTFAVQFHTVLAGGRPEPVYHPAKSNGDTNRIYYREDYFASALHEVAHWCIAGQQRRQETDYGYWYAPDGRTAMQQRAFELAEQKPQALEWIFSIACGWLFNLSADNLNADMAIGSQAGFANAVKQSALAYCESGLPTRAACFFSALSHFYFGDQGLSLSREVYEIVHKTTLFCAGN